MDLIVRIQSRHFATLLLTSCSSKIQIAILHGQFLSAFYLLLRYNAFLKVLSIVRYLTGRDRISSQWFTLQVILQSHLFNEILISKLFVLFPFESLFKSHLDQLKLMYRFIRTFNDILTLCSYLLYFFYLILNVLIYLEWVIEQSLRIVFCVVIVFYVYGRCFHYLSRLV